VRYAWFALYLFPFLLMLVYPYRMLVPYEKALQKLCELTFSKMDAEGTLANTQSLTGALGVQVVRPSVGHVCLKRVPTQSCSVKCALYRTATDGDSPGCTVL
jgi:hypothetical protein